MKRRENLTLQKAVTMYINESQFRQQYQHQGTSNYGPNTTPGYDNSKSNYDIYAGNTNQKY